MGYKRKTLPEVEVISMKEDSTDEDGGKGVMTYKQFMELYEESSDGTF